MMLEGVFWFLLFAGVMIVSRLICEWRGINRRLSRLCDMPHERYLQGLGPGPTPTEFPCHAVWRGNSSTPSTRAILSVRLHTGQTAFM
jgi:hypothetical protein